jgi:hypothetical protein
MAKANGQVPNGAHDDDDDDDDADDDDEGQTAAIDGWIDALLLRHDIEFARTRIGITIDVPPKLVAVIGALIDGIYAAARGQELPELPPAVPKPAKPTKPTKAKPKKR